ncbi:Protein of unknown function DUF3754 [Dillenia turbinata]|uniref:Uncharacterized protein n=1 Tax=Dillenia turbinata TaxID=194707 RepID=A0AAN8VCI9_9MAGN
MSSSQIFIGGGVKAHALALSPQSSSPRGGIACFSFLKSHSRETLGKDVAGRRNGIEVPRPKYIRISKGQLLDALVSLFPSQRDRHHFLVLSSFLDSILHAEHKAILEAMRSDYSMQQQHGGPFPNTSQHNSSFEPSHIVLGKLEEALPVMIIHSNVWIPSWTLWVAVATRFQRSFIQLLNNAEFEELSAQDLILTSALKTDYLLTLPISVDWRRAAESNAIIFRRGYATERQKGLLIAEKMDYLQSKLLQGILYFIAKPLRQIGMWICKATNSPKARASMSSIPRVKLNINLKKLVLTAMPDFGCDGEIGGSGAKIGRAVMMMETPPSELAGFREEEEEALKDATKTEEVQIFMEKIKLWLGELLISQQPYTYDEQSSDSFLELKQLADGNLPIWLAAQRAVTRYEGLLSSVGSRGRLLLKLLSLTGFIPPTPERKFKLAVDTTTLDGAIFLPRISLNDIWRPATRKECGNDVWKMLNASAAILFSQSTLQEPAFQELILLYTKVERDETTGEMSEDLSLQLKVYERIPIPDLPVIFPHKKLSFRILDMVRLDAATIVGLLAYFVNYKFEDILSSPSAILLDVIGISALIIYVTRVALGYKQTWDRYQLLVNRTLYEKTLASGFGSVYFLLDASEQQQYKEAILAYAMLVRADKAQVLSCRSIAKECEEFMYNSFREKMEMPIEKAMATLERLGLAKVMDNDGSVSLQAVPCSHAHTTLQQRWNDLLNYNQRDS